MNSTTNIVTGLTTEQVLQAPRNIPAHHVSDIELGLSVLKNQIASFFFVLLIVSGMLSMALHQNVDAIIFLAIAGINVVIGFFQEFRAGKSTIALEKLVTHTVSVRRNGILEKIASVDVVLGDIVVGEPGDVIVADMIICESTDLLIDESLRTGETLPRQTVNGEQLFAGSSIIQGVVSGQVTAIGKQSSLMMYADKISKVVKDSNFEKFINSVSKYILIFTVFCLGLVFVMNVLVNHNVTMSEYVLYAIALLVGVVPQSLPLIVTIILSREALVLAKNNVIVKKLSVLQNLGSMDYLFTDKTGTITENNLKVQSLIGDQSPLVDAIGTIVNGNYERTPMDTVFDNAFDVYLQTESVISPITKQDLMLSPFQIARGYSVYTLPNGQEIIRGQYAKICQVCGSDNATFADTCLKSEIEGFRVIAFAIKQSSNNPYTLLGAALFEDPLKADAATIYRELQDLGINIKIITGDSVAVATHIGNILDHTIDEKKVFNMDTWKPTNNMNIEAYSIYARSNPDQKSELIEQHLDDGVVGFLGEGINDALALKRADIGFVVNNASDVARQSADVILLKKSLEPIISAIKLSRQAFAHVRTYLLCTLAGNIGTLISLTAVVVLWQQIPMLPIQILLNNLLTDIPLMFIITDNIAPSIINRPIRDQASRFFKMVVIFAIISSLFDFIFFFAFKGYSIEILRTGWLVFSVLAELTLVFSLRSELSLFKSPKLSKTLWVVLGICYAAALALPYAHLEGIFHLYPLPGIPMLVIIGIMAVYLCMNELTKRSLFNFKTSADQTLF